LLTGPGYARLGEQEKAMADEQNLPVLIDSLHARIVSIRDSL